MRNITKKLKVAIVVGARPNFMKAAPLLREMKASPRFEPILIHTGQHYDALMSDSFFKDLDLPMPHLSLGVGSGTQAEQTAKIMLALEEPFKNHEKMKPDLVMVVGDVNSTLAATLTAKKLQIPVAHVEAGLRSFDETMPEEINRVLTDHVSNFLFTTEPAANENLRKEGVSSNKIHYVGNVMIDTLLGNLEKIKQSSILSKLSLAPKQYAVLTLHRPSNVDDKDDFKKILSVIYDIAQKIHVVFPVHPRTKRQIEALGYQSDAHIKFIEPLGYIDFLKLVQDAKFVLTDSGGLQEETTVLGIPCLTLRKNTERPITVEVGTNIVTGDDRATIIAEADKILAGNGKKGTIPSYWDGRASERIVQALANFYE